MAAQQQALTERLDELSRDLSTGRHEGRADGGEGSVNRGRRKRRGVGEIPEATPFVPKCTKLDFPKYDGSIDPLGWINRWSISSGIKIHQQNKKWGWLPSILREMPSCGS
ncbi:hypothetical protein CCACVL1_17511 [Corchorus capsularis]|uniref:Uncharacterized protein n=1 Tax=Corchorus capsularis TaxID=210143 RepID=A0A1R3HR94_COCAP|nr:hypothetical protein CCACVL1_17511 [Corchorus capsularis]